MTTPDMTKEQRLELKTLAKERKRLEGGLKANCESEKRALKAAERRVLQLVATIKRTQREVRKACTRIRRTSLAERRGISRQIGAIEDRQAVLAGRLA